MVKGAVSPGPPPKFTRLSGEALWLAVLNRYELEQHELLILREIVRCVDDLDRLANIAGRQGAITASGEIHPAVAEARQMRMTLATLIAALRLPAENEEDQASLRRPQRRPAVRSVGAPTEPGRPEIRAAVSTDDGLARPLPLRAVAQRIDRPAPTRVRLSAEQRRVASNQVSVAELMAKLHNGQSAEARRALPTT